jgi:hypothetical protein
VGVVVLMRGRVATTYHDGATRDSVDLTHTMLVASDLNEPIPLLP